MPESDLAGPGPSHKSPGTRGTPGDTRGTPGDPFPPPGGTHAGGSVGRGGGSVGRGGRSVGRGGGSVGRGARALKVSRPPRAPKTGSRPPSGTGDTRRHASACLRSAPGAPRPPDRTRPAPGISPKVKSKRPLSLKKSAGSAGCPRATWPDPDRRPSALGHGGHTRTRASVPAECPGVSPAARPNATRPGNLAKS